MFNTNRKSIFDEGGEVEHAYKPNKEETDLVLGNGTILRRNYNIQRNEDMDIITDKYDPYENKKSIFCTDTDVETMRKDLKNYGSEFGVRFKETPMDEEKVPRTLRRGKERRKRTNQKTETVSLDGLFCHDAFPFTDDRFAIADKEAFKIIFNDLGKSTYIYVDNFLMDLIRQKRENRGVLEIQVGEFRNVARFNFLSYKSHCKRMLKDTNKELQILTFAYTEGEFRELRDTIFLVHIALEEPAEKKFKSLSSSKQFAVRMDKSERKKEIENDEINRFTGNFFSFVYDTSLNKSYVLED